MATELKTTLADILAGYEVLKHMEDVPTEDRERLLASVTVQGRDKVTSMALAYKHLKADIAARETYADSILARNKAAVADMAWLQTQMKVALETLSLDEVKHALANVFLKDSQPSVEVVDEAQVPDRLKRATLVTLRSEVPEELIGAIKKVEVEKAAILELHKQGQPLPPGVKIARGKHLLVK